MHEIREATGSERLAFYLADFCSLAQVRTLAESESSGSRRSRIGHGQDSREAESRETSRLVRSKMTA